MKGLTLQSRVALWSALFIVLGMILCGVAITAVAYHEETQELDEDLRAEGRRIFEEWEQHGGAAKYPLKKKPGEIREWLPATHPPQLVEVADTNDVVIYRSKNLLSDALRGQPAGLRDLTIDGRRWRFAGFEKDGIIFRIAADLEPVWELTRNLLMAFLAALPVLLVFVVVSGRWVARRALEPVRRITAAAESITAEKPHEELPVPLAHDEIQRLALVLNATFDRLKRSFAQAQRFSADASHELKTPLTVLRASIESLSESPTLASVDQEAVAALLEQTRRLSSITESLLLLSRADAGRLRLDVAPADVREIVAACVEDAQIIAAPRGITIEADLPPALRASVDRGRLSQIVVNLLDNAVKYNRDGGWVQVAAEQADGALAIRVANTGDGIAPEHAPRLFDRFFRADAASGQEGSGLGLSLARELARAHGGDLTLTRSDAEWTQFCLTLRS